MQITKMILTQILDMINDNILNKHQGGVQIRFNIFMMVFRVDDHPLRVVTALSG